jgi:hypothetical protein
MKVGRRALLLEGLLAAGSMAALAGYAVTGVAWWFVAVPAAVAAGWLFVADPARCEAPKDAPPGPRGGAP